MAGTCNLCGGLITAGNEVLGYAGPICNGTHAQPTTYTIVSPAGIDAKLDEIIRLLKTLTPTKKEG